MTREEAILWMQVLKHAQINWVGEQAEEEDIIARCEEAEQEAFEMAIDALHTEVVRCKDCRHYGQGNCYMYGGQMNEDDFCSRAERKDK